MRKALTAGGLLALLALTGCATTQDPPPDDADRVAQVASIDHGVAALPGPDELPAGFTMDYRCPGGEFCLATTHDEASVNGAAPAPSGVVEPDFWLESTFGFSIEVYADPEAAQDALETERDSLAEKSGDFEIAPEPTENGFIPGETGSGEASDIEIEGWAGVQGHWTGVTTAPEDDPSAERQTARIVVASESAIIDCQSGRYATEDAGLASSDCTEAIEGYLDRLAEIDPADAPRVTTSTRLAAALPDDGDLPAGYEESVRCPGDPPCNSDERQKQDASLSVDLALPDGVTAEGDGRLRFLVAGGEWTENLTLQAYIKSDDAAAQAAVAERTSGYGTNVGELNTPAKATDSGYDFGIDGRGEVIDISGEGWSGQLKLYEARFLHLDGRVGDPRFDISGAVSSGDVLLTIDSSLTVEGRDQADAVGTVEEQIAGFFARLSAAP